MLYEMVCGHRPYPQFEGPRFRRELEHAIVSNAPRAQLPDSCPPALSAIINKLLAFQVEHRYPSAAAIKADLEAFLRGDPPEALTIYETPATTPVHRVAGGAAAATAVAEPIVLTTPATVPRSREVPPTEPLPSTPAKLAPARVRVNARRRTVRQAAKAAAVLLAILVVGITEGVAWIFAERFRDTMSNLDERSVTERKQAYDGVDRAGLLDLGLRARVNRRLRPALVAVGERVIADYRREEPAMGPAEWTQAYAALSWALDLSRSTRSLRGKQLTAAGHVKRFEAQAARGGAATLLSQEALARFRAAADADPESFDPYLGMARLQVYALADVDAAAASIEEAEQRGYVPGRREAALLGDGYLRRATAAWRRARVLTGEQRVRELNLARSDYERCVQLFDPIVAFGNAAKNLEICKAQLETVTRMLEPEEES